jgi:hypothetical protein
MAKREYKSTINQPDEFITPLICARADTNAAKASPINNPYINHRLRSECVILMAFQITTANESCIQPYSWPRKIIDLLISTPYRDKTSEGANKNARPKNPDTNALNWRSLLSTIGHYLFIVLGGITALSSAAKDLINRYQFAVLPWSAAANG